MKSRILILWGCLFPLLTLAQGSMDFTLTVLNNRGSAMKDVPIVLVDLQSNQRLVKKTGAGGKVNFAIDQGKEWTVHVLDIRNMLLVKVPERGHATRNRTVTYDPVRWARENRPPVDRSQLAISTKKQRIRPNTRPEKGKSVVVLTVKRENRRPLANMEVALTSYALQTSFVATTNTLGQARFLVPNNQEYEIDIDGIESFKYIDLPEYSGRHGMDFVYEPTTIRETVQGDTVFQQLPPEVKATSARAHLTLRTKDIRHELLSNENVYLHCLKNNKVYVTKTNTRGEAEFLLPTGAKYMIHFDYERDADIQDFTRFKGIGTAYKNVMYRPDPKLKFAESYIPTPQTLFTRYFNAFLEKQAPPPRKGKSLGVFARFANKIHPKSKEAVMELGFSAVAPTERLGAPLNICFVVDRSGSMGGYNRIESLKRSLKAYIGNLRPDDHVALVVFNTAHQVLVPSQPLGNGEQVLAAIEDVHASGGTVIYDGMIAGYQEVQKHYVPGHTNRVILLTDGHGTTPVDQMVSGSKSYNEKGIELSAIGVGQGYNQALLAQLATVGGGLLHYAGEHEAIDKVFTEELNSVLLPVAKNVTVEVEYNQQIIFKQLYGFPIASKHAGNFRLDLAKIHGGLNKLALVQFTLNNPTRAIEKQPVIVRMRYFDYLKNAMDTVETRAYPEWLVSDEDLAQLMDRQDKKLYAIAIMNQSLKVMAEAYAGGNRAAAEAAIQSTLEQVQRLYPDAMEDDVAELAKELEGYAQAFVHIAWKESRQRLKADFTR